MSQELKARGWKTSEFWVTVLMVVCCTILIALGKIEVDDIGKLWPLFAGAIGYSASRSIAKLGS